jgi:hypothetical protein
VLSSIPGAGAPGVLTRIFVESVGRFYEERAARRGACGAAKSGAVTVVQRTSGDMRLNPHLHVVFLDGAYHEDGTELVWNELGHLRAREVGQVIEHAVGRMLRYLRRHGHLEIERDVEEARRRGGRRARGSALCLRRLGTRAAPHVVASQWLRGLSPSSPSALAYDKPLCAALDGFTLHAATRAGAHHAAAREALLRYVLHDARGPTLSVCCATRLCTATRLLLPLRSGFFYRRAGRMAGRGWGVVEANPAWASGLCGCNPSRLLPVLQRATVPRRMISEAEQRWLRRVG